MLAAAVGVEGPVEGDIGSGRDVVDDRLRSVEKDMALDAIGRTFAVFALDPLTVDLFAEDMEADGFESVAGI